MVDKFAPVCRRQAFIAFERKPLVIIQELFDCLLHKRFRRAALLRRYARQFSLLVRGQLHFHSRPFYCARSSPQARLHARRASNARKCCGVARMARFEPLRRNICTPFTRTRTL
jgi:hypothetical protein